MCKHKFYDTNYCTQICHECGIEKPTGIPPIEGYTTNVPLTNGYSRHNRMNMLLKQLFSPRYYGSPNSQVIARALKHGPFTHGTKLLNWLVTLKVKHKQYQNAHYYFAIASPNYVIPKPPSYEKVHSIEHTFHILEQGFMARNHTYKSFFSYNWLLRKFLQESELGFYLQFVKTIKCKRRMKMYENMWEFFTTPAVPLPDTSHLFQIPPLVQAQHQIAQQSSLFLHRHPHHSEGNVVAIRDAFRSSQKRPGELQPNDSRPPQVLQETLYLLLKSHLNNSAPAT